MLKTSRLAIFLPLLTIFSPAWADQPAFEYFVIKRERLNAAIKSAPQLIKIPAAELENLSELHGWINKIDNCDLKVASANFRISLSTKFSLSLNGGKKF